MSTALRRHVRVMLCCGVLLRSPEPDIRRCVGQDLFSALTSQPRPARCTARSLRRNCTAPSLRSAPPVRPDGTARRWACPSRTTESRAVCSRGRSPLDPRQCQFICRRVEGGKLTPNFKRRVVTGDGREVLPKPAQHRFGLLDAAPAGVLAGAVGVHRRRVAVLDGQVEALFVSGAK